MRNVTMTIDDDILKKAKKIAIETVILELRADFSDKNVRVGKINWRREEIHER